MIGALESPRASITTLARHFGFDAVETGGVIRFVMRGRAAVAEIGTDDLVAAPDPRAEGLELIRGYALRRLFEAIGARQDASTLRTK